MLQLHRNLVNRIDEEIKLTRKGLDEIASTIDNYKVDVEKEHNKIDTQLSHLRFHIVNPDISKDVHRQHREFLIKRAGKKLGPELVKLLNTFDELPENASK